VLSKGHLVSEYDGTQWFQTERVGPGARNRFAMAYDERRGVTVLFGGQRGSNDGNELLGDTWTWDGDTWRRGPATGPTPRPRTNHRMVYDRDREVVILFGGNADSAGSGLDDTWEWDGSRWTRLSTTGPSPRMDVGLAYDARNRQVILYGGRYRTPREWVHLRDTWILGRREVWVDPAYRGPESGHLESPFNTLSEGVSAAPNGAALRIKPGTLNERVRIAKPMQIDAPFGDARVGSPKALLVQGLEPASPP